MLHFITWMLRLPSDLEPAFEQGLQDIEQEYNMPHVMSFERNALAKGQAIGEEIGEERGEKRGEARGEARGEIKAMHAMLQRLLTLKFGPLPDWADARLKQANTEMLTLWSERVLFADTLEGVFETEKPKLELHS